jgi:integrase
MAVLRRGRTWRVQVSTRDPVTGKRVRRCWTFDSEREAREFEARQYAELERLREQHVRPTMVRLADYLAEWLRRKSNEVAPRTLHDYRWCVEKMIVPALGDKALADLSPADVQRWQDALAPTRDAPGATIAAKAFRVLRSALSDAERLGLIPRNPCKAARPAQRSRNRREGFTVQEARAILAAAEGERLASLFAFILHSGLRVAEALGLRWSDVDMDAGTVSVRQDMVYVGGRMVPGRPKTDTSARTFALTPHALAALRDQKARQAEERLRAGEAWQDTGLVFTASNGAPLNTANVDRAFRRVREKAGVRPLPLYSLRHATASILLAAGVPPALAAKMLGHSLAMFTETYADLLLEASREAAEQAGRFWERAASRAEERPAPVVPIRRGG